jgi:uncharacterized membrane protein YkvI
MTQRTAWQSFQVACVYIGTVVGAGFASGREIYQFFVRFGSIAYLGIAISTLLFAYIGYRLMALGAKLKAKSFREVNFYLFGSSGGAVANTLSLLMLFGVTVAMLAGAGALFQERIGLSFQVGVLLTIFVTYLTLLRGIEGIYRANVIIVPLMVSFVLYTGVHTFHTLGTAPAAVAASSIHSSWLSIGISSIVYGALNIGLSAGVLIPLGGEVQNLHVLRRGALYGAAGLGLMLTAITFTLFSYAPQVFDSAIPMGYVATKLGTLLQYGFLLVLWGEVYSTLVGNVYALTAHVAKKPRSYAALYTLSLLLIAWVCSQIGFTKIVAYGYTVFGWMCLWLLAAVVWPRGKDGL